MKALILILLAAVYSAAQTPTVADVARKERARRAQSRNIKVYTTEDIRTTVPVIEDVDPAAVPGDGVPVEGASAEGVSAATPESAGLTPAPLEPAGVETPAPASGEDPVLKWLQENERLRVELRDLMDQENVTQLEINALTNQVNAPVTSQSAKDQASTSLQAAQEKLKGIRERIAKVRQEIQAKEAQGPPKK